MPIRRASDYRRSRWKNGGGETIEIAITPHGAGLDAFDWRISMATMAMDGVFSVFSGVDRTLAILEGAGIALSVGGAPARMLHATSDPFAFSGDLVVSATLVDGPVTDFNVMTRRSQFLHTVRRVQLAPGDRLTSDINATVVFCSAGTLEFVSGAESARLDRFDALVLGGTEAKDWILRALAPAALYVVAISAAQS